MNANKSIVGATVYAYDNESGALTLKKGNTYVVYLNKKYVAFNVARFDPKYSATVKKYIENAITELTRQS